MIKVNNSNERYLLISLYPGEKPLTVYPKLTFSDDGIQVEVKKETEGLTTDSFKINGETILFIELQEEGEITSVSFEGKEIPKRGT